MRQSATVCSCWWMLTCLVSMIVSGGVAEAKSADIQIQGATQPWMEKPAMNAAKEVLQKLGYEIAAPGSPADVVITVAIESAHSHHAVSPTLGLLGGVIDFWNHDAAHAAVQSTVQEGDKEVARQSARASKYDVPIFGWLQPAKRVRTKALRAAVKASLKDYSSRHAPAMAQ
jgi:hypothetical protein